MRSDKVIVPILLFLIFLIKFSFAEVDINITAGNQVNVSLENNTNRTWYLGGWRMQANNNAFNSVEGNGYLVSTNESKNGGYEHTTQSTSNAPQWATKVNPNTTFTGKSAGWGSGADYVASDPYVLLKTSSFGVPDKPVDEDPITLDQLDSLIQTPNFYNADYRSIDSLGRYGGKYSGGFRYLAW